MTVREEDRTYLTYKLVFGVAKGYGHRLTRSSGSPNLRGTPNNLEQVLRRLDRYDLRGNVQTSEFLKDRIEFFKKTSMTSPMVFSQRLFLLFNQQSLDI